MPSDKVITSVASTISFALAFVILLIGGPILLLLVPLFICAALWLFVLLLAMGMAQVRFNVKSSVHAFGPLLGAAAATVLYLLLNSGD